MTSSGSIFCVIGVPQFRPMWTRAQIAKARPRAKSTSPIAASHGSELGAVVSKRAEPDQEDHKGDDHEPDPQLARPRNAAALHREGRHQPVEPERRPADGEDELDRPHRHAWFQVEPVWDNPQA